MAWNWQPVETAPVGKLILIAVCKGTLQCPVRDDRYVAMAVRRKEPADPARPTSEWTVFGQAEIREDEIVTHWIEPELPEGFPEGPDITHRTMGVPLDPSTMQPKTPE